jgi:hypothetical protein
MAGDAGTEPEPEVLPLKNVQHFSNILLKTVEISFHLFFMMQDNFTRVDVLLSVFK